MSALVKRGHPMLDLAIASAEVAFLRGLVSAQAANIIERRLSGTYHPVLAEDFRLYRRKLHQRQAEAEALAATFLKGVAA
jgi:hypothetical protein